MSAWRNRCFPGIFFFFAIPAFIAGRLRLRIWLREQIGFRKLEDLDEEIVRIIMPEKIAAGGPGELLKSARGPETRSLSE